MNHTFTLKSYQNGLAITIKQDADIEEFMAELTEKFQNSRKFFGNMQVSLAISGKELTPEEENRIVDCVEENSDLKILYLIGNDAQMQELFQNLHEKKKADEAAADAVTGGQFYRGSLKKGQSLETEHSIIIMGDVNEGAKVFCKRDVIVLGTLSGEVFAGMDDEPGHFVCALSFSPEKLKIGPYKYRKKPDKKFWPDSHKKTPKIASLEGEEVVVKPVTKELLGKFAEEMID